jgi:hypothetical protein
LKKSPGIRKARLEALKKESDLAEKDLIRRLLALPPKNARISCANASVSA